MDDREKTPEELREELYQKLANNQQHLCEVAMPGVVRNVNAEEVSSETK